MRLIFTGLAWSTAVLVLSAVASPQTPVQVPVPSQVQRPAATPANGLAATPQDQLVTVTGCVQRESDYRRIRKGSNAVTVIGNSGALVLINAAAAVIGSPVAGTQAQLPRNLPANGGSGSAAQSVGGATAVPAATTGGAYQLIGRRESEAATLVARWVEITGTLRDAPEGTPPESTAAGAGSNVTDVTSRDLYLRQLEVDSIRAVGGACATQ